MRGWSPFNQGIPEKDILSKLEEEEVEEVEEEGTSDKKHIGGNLRKKIVYGKLGKDIKKADNQVYNDTSKLLGRKTHSGTGNKGVGRLKSFKDGKHTYWQK